MTYEVTDRPTPTSLQIGVRQKTYGPPFLMIGLDLNNIDSTNFAVNLAGRVLHYGLLGVGSETRLNFVLGTTQLLGAEVVKPIGTTPLFVAPRVYFDRRGRNLYQDDIFVAEYRIRQFGAGLDIGSDFGRNSEVRLGYDITDYKGRRRVGAPDLPDVDGSEQYAHLDFAIDTQTSPLVPTRGFRLRSTLRQYFEAPTASSTLDDVEFESPQSFTSGEVRTSWFRRVRGGGDRVFVIGEAGSSFGEDPLVNDFSLGGPLRLGSFNNDQLRGDNYLLFGGGYLRGVGRMPDVLGGSIFLGAWVEGGSAFNDWDNQDWKSDITGGAILETLLGPVFVGGSIGLPGRRPLLHLTGAVLQVDRERHDLFTMVAKLTVFAKDCLDFFANMVVLRRLRDYVVVRAVLLDRGVGSSLRRMAAPLGGIGHVGFIELRG